MDAGAMATSFVDRSQHDPRLRLHSGTGRPWKSMGTPVSATTRHSWHWVGLDTEGSWFRATWYSGIAIAYQRPPEILIGGTGLHQGKSLPATRLGISCGMRTRTDPIIGNLIGVVTYTDDRCGQRKARH